MKNNQTQKPPVTPRRAISAILAGICALSGMSDQARAEIISSETPVTMKQYEVFTGGMRMRVGGTPGRRMTVRLYEVAPDGTATQIKSQGFQMKVPFFWLDGANKLHFPARLFKAGSGLRYAFTLQPEGNRRTEISVSGPWFVVSPGGGEAWWAGPDPVHKPYPDPHAGRRLPVTVEGNLPDITEE